VKRIVLLAMAAVLFLAPKVSAKGVVEAFWGPYSPNLEQMNEDIDDGMNKQLGTNFRLEGKGTMYSFAVGKLDISFYQTSSKDSYTLITHPPDMPSLIVRTELNVEAKLIAIPLFLTKIYQITPKGNLSFHLGVGLGTVFTDLVFSQNGINYFIPPNGKVRDTTEYHWDSHIIATPLAGQVLAGIGYRLNKRMSLLAETRYIGTSKANLEDKEKGIKTSINWSGFSYRIGLKIRI